MILCLDKTTNDFISELTNQLFDDVFLNQLYDGIR